MTVRIVLQGFGAMGQEVVRALADREDAEVVAVLDVAPALVDRPVAEVAGVHRWPALRVQQPDDVDLASLGADVAVQTITAYAAEAAPHLERLLAAGLDVVTLCQELVHPVPERGRVAEAIDRAARAAGRSVVAGGVNPGWVLDVLPVAASLGCVAPRSVHVTRVVDFSPYGPDEMAHIGAGLDPDEFRRGADEGRIGHIGLRESALLVADALGLGVDRWEETREPVLADRVHSTPFVRVEPGRARGFRQRVRGWRGDREVADFAMVGLLDLGAGDPELGDRIRIEATPSMSLTVHGEDAARGGEATAGVATNLIGPVLAAPPGLHTVLTLPLARSRSRLRLP